MAAHLQHRVQAARAPAGQKVRGFHPSNLTQLFMFHSRGDCSLDILGASPAHTRDQDDVVEEEEAAVLPDTDVECRCDRYCSRYVRPPDPGAGAGGDEVVPQQVPGGRHQVVVPQPVDHHLQLPQLLLPGLNNKYFYWNLNIFNANVCLTSCSLLSFSMVDILVASSWISLSALLSSRKSSWLCSVCSSSLWIWAVVNQYKYFCASVVFS